MENRKVRILGVSCAHRKGRNTAWLVQFSLKAIEKFGRRIHDIAQIETNFVDLANKKTKPCTDCDLCYSGDIEFSKGVFQRSKDIDCPIKDDYIAKELLPMMAEADGFIFGAPVFCFSYTGRFRILTERLAAWQAKGWFANKPAAVVTVALMGVGAGQESCLAGMNHCIKALGMIPVSWAHGAPGNSGPPLGPLPGDDDGKEIASKKDFAAQFIALYNARRVAEVALMQKLAIAELGDLYVKDFSRV